MAAKPGVYTQRKADGVLKSEFNIANKPSMAIAFNPKDKIFKVARKKPTSIAAYPILKAMGVDDDALEKAWGKDILEANKKARGVDTALEAFYRADRKSAPKSKTEG